MYNLFYYNIHKLTDELYAQELALLPKLRQKQIQRKANMDDRKRSLAGDILVRTYLSKLYHVAPETLMFARGAHGKPYVLNLDAHFSVAHSGPITAVAISDSPIGIDIEMIRDFSAIVAKKKFSRTECDYIAGQTVSKIKPDMQKSFYEIWTAKEAYLKYLGCGLSGGLDALQLKIEGNHPVSDREDVELIYDYSIPGAVVAVVLPKRQ